MPFKYKENVAIADVAFEATGKTLNELFEACALAATDVMVDPKTVSADAKKDIIMESEKLDNLLFDFLAEIIFLKDAEMLLFSKYYVKIEEKKNGSEGEIKYSLHCQALGEIINPEKHKLRADVKAVTYHMFELKKAKTGWKAFIVLDI